MCLVMAAMQLLAKLSGKKRSDPTGRSILFCHQFLRFLRLFAALISVENALADAIRLGRDFEQLVVCQIFDRFIERHLPGWRQSDFHIAARGPNIREMFFLAYVDWHILVA